MTLSDTSCLQKVVFCLAVNCAVIFDASVGRNGGDMTQEVARFVPEFDYRLTELYVTGTDKPTDTVAHPGEERRAPLQRVPGPCG